MKDLIDERNRREKMQNSIVKWWNVNWVSIPEEEDAFANLSEEEKDAAMDIIARLNAEAEADEALKAAEVEEAKRQVQEKHKKEYNYTTGSYSGTYGKNQTADEDAMNQIDKILKEKEESFMKTLENTKSGMA